MGVKKGLIGGRGGGMIGGGGVWDHARQWLRGGLWLGSLC